MFLGAAELPVFDGGTVFVKSKTKQKFGQNHDYSWILPEHIRGNDSCINIKCNICSYEWTTALSTYIYSKYGCGNCYGNVTCTLERFLVAAHEIHENRFDYSRVTNEHIRGNKSRIPVRCTLCNYSWNPTIICHLNRNCPGCAGQAPWTLERFLSKAREIHTDRYNYSQVTEKHIRTCTSYVPIKCTVCDYVFNPTISNHIFKKSGCPQCNRSHGELACQSVLDILGIKYKSEYIVNTLPRKRFDFIFMYQGKYYILEFDGIQHFEYTPHFHSNEYEFQRKQRTDIKSKHALRSGCNLIRIDYTQMNNVEFHIRNALASLDDTYRVYYSNIQMYNYIVSVLRPTKIKF